MSATRAAAGWLALALAAGACANSRVPRVGDPAPTARDDSAEQTYQAVLGQVTDRQAIYDGLDTRLFVSATWQAEDFVTARVRREAAFRDLTPATAEAMLTAERDRLKNDTVFFMGVHANEPRHDDFDRPDSIWSLSLVSGDQQLRPIEVRRIGRSNADMRALYPYMDTFWVGYEVRFGPASPPMKLKVASSLGEAVLGFGARAKE